LCGINRDSPNTLSVELSPSPSEEDSPAEEPAPLESEDDASEIASEQEGPSITLNTVDDDLEDEDDQDPDADAEIDPDATGDMDEDLDEMDATGEIDPESELDPLSAVNTSRLTARQAALVGGGSAMDHVMLREFGDLDCWEGIDVLIHSRGSE
jgi:hypothetical protein